MTTRPLIRVRRNAHVRIVAPASAVNRQAIENCRTALEKRGFQVSYGPHLFERHNPHLHLAGDDRSRAQDVMDALLDPAVDWVLAARGGYGTMRILPLLDARRLASATPKPVVGFSDITALHHFLGRIGWWTIHGPNAHSNWAGETGENFMRLVAEPMLEIAPEPLESLANRPPETLVAPWRGGNLALLAALIGTPYEPDWTDTVLYLEEVHEKPYRIDRMLQQLRLAGMLTRVRGIVFGEALFDGEDRQEAVKDLVAELAFSLGIPAWWGLPSGHRDPMLSLPLGVPMAIEPWGAVRIMEGAILKWP